MSGSTPYARRSLDDRAVQVIVEALRGDWLRQGPAVAASNRRGRRAGRAVVALRDLRARDRRPRAGAAGLATWPERSVGRRNLRRRFSAARRRCTRAAWVPATRLVTRARSSKREVQAYFGATPHLANLEGATRNVSQETIGAALSDPTRAAGAGHGPEPDGERCSRRQHWRRRVAGLYALADLPGRERHGRDRSPLRPGDRSRGHHARRDPVRVQRSRRRATSTCRTVNRPAAESR